MERVVISAGMPRARSHPGSGAGAVQGAEPDCEHRPRRPGRLCPAGWEGPCQGRRGLSTASGCFLEQEEKFRAFTPEQSLVIKSVGSTGRQLITASAELEGIHKDHQSPTSVPAQNGPKNHTMCLRVLCKLRISSLLRPEVNRRFLHSSD